jgi:hypothetical protein
VGGYSAAGRARMMLSPIGPGGQPRRRPGRESRHARCWHPGRVAGASSETTSRVDHRSAVAGSWCCAPPSLRSLPPRGQQRLPGCSRPSAPFSTRGFEGHPAPAQTTPHPRATCSVLLRATPRCCCSIISTAEPPNQNHCTVWDDLLSAPERLTREVPALVALRLVARPRCPDCSAVRPARELSRAARDRGRAGQAASSCHSRAIYRSGRGPRG